MRRVLAPAALILLVASAPLSLRDDPLPALRSIRAEAIRAHLYFLSHDLLEGRAPATRGGELAAAYIAGQFKRHGLEPVAGSHFQRVPLVATSVEAGGVDVRFGVGERRVQARYPDDVVVWSGPDRPRAELDAEVVFVGYGVHAPEFGWDDFEGLDVAGKVVLVLVGDPPAPPDEPALFDGRAMTYYGRWSYKLEEAERRGAAGALIVHAEAAAGYPWRVVRDTWARERLQLPRTGQPGLELEGWITREFAGRLLAEAGLNPAELYVRSARRDFRPVRTGIELAARLDTRVRHVQSDNVLGLLRGTDPERRDEVVVFTAHYDHLGVGPAVGGDSIFNGAYDNASGVAVLLEIAGAFARLERPPPRSVLFLATTAEEAGLLGATHYVRNPAFPIPRTAAAINIDGANLWGETDDAIALGGERSTLGEIAERRAAELGLRLSHDRAPERGLYFRSDHFAFARAGVPALAVEHGLEFRGRPAGWGDQLMRRYEAQHYHRPSDRYSSELDLAGAVQQARLAFLIGYDVATAAGMPEWKPGSRPAAAAER